MPQMYRFARAIFILWLSASTASGQAGGRGEPTQGERLLELEKLNRDLARRLEKLEGEESAGFGATDTEEEGAGEYLDDIPFGMQLEYGDVAATVQIFGDVGFSYTNPDSADQGNSLFSLGSLSLLLNTQFGPNLRMLSESVVEVDSNDDGQISQERLWVMWQYDDSFYAKLGTEHSPLARYNQLYHHGLWFETSVTRPQAVLFEGGGILPLHRTGLQLGGRVENDLGGFEYFGFVSNGRGIMPTDKQRSSDEDDSKALDAGLAFEPISDFDLRFGVSGTYDEIPDDPNSLDPLRARSMREVILAGHAEWNSGPLELRCEYFHIEHEARATGEVFTSDAAYVQAEFPRESWTPYVRLDFLDMKEGDPFYAPLDRDLDAWGPAVGFRHDLSPNVAVKLEGSFLRQDERDGGGGITTDDVVSLALQVSWWL